MAAFGMFLALPLMLLNLLGGILSGIVLLIMGDWRLVVGGLLWSVAAPFILSIAMLPGMIFAPLAVWAGNRNNTVAMVAAGLPAMLWTYLVVAVSCVLVFTSIASQPNAGIVHYIWAYGVATGPWSYMAQKDRQSGNDSASELMMFVQFGTISMIIGSLVDSSDINFQSIMVWFLPFLALGILFQLLTAWARISAERRRSFL